MRDYLLDETIKSCTSDGCLFFLYPLGFAFATGPGHASANKQAAYRQASAVFICASFAPHDLRRGAANEAAVAPVPASCNRAQLNRTTLNGRAEIFDLATYRLSISL